MEAGREEVFLAAEEEAIIPVVIRSLSREARRHHFGFGDALGMHEALTETFVSGA